MSQALDAIKTLEGRINQSILGQEKVVEKIITTLLADGNLLLEGLPGLAKTRAIKSLSKALKLNLSRIQFTPDLLPSDITGTEIYQPESEEKFVFEQGPIFANLILADEINRAPAKVQAALLEAMEERQVTVSGKTYVMEKLFFVMATQNPVEQEGTYPLPEAQLDRFLMKAVMNYPSKENERKVVQLVREEQSDHSPSVEKPLDAQIIFEARKQIEGVSVSETAEQYMVDIVDATRFPKPYSEELASWIQVGVSPRATIALDKCSRITAWRNGRDHVIPDDIRHVAHDIMRHRIMLSYEANAKGITPDMVIDEVLKNVAVLA